MPKILACNELLPRGEARARLLSCSYWSYCSLLPADMRCVWVSGVG